MKIAGLGEKIGYLGKSKKQKQTMITLGEAYSIWKLLVMRYDALFTSKMLLDFTKDQDLKKIVTDGIEVLETQKNVLEQLTKDFSIPMPNRPAEDSNVAIDINTLTDRYIYRHIFDSLANTSFKHMSNYQRANSAYLRETFRNFLNEELDLYDAFFEYGKLKGYLNDPPSFR